MTENCSECGHSEPHSYAGLGVCGHPGCGCDGPMSDETREFLRRLSEAKKRDEERIDYVLDLLGTYWHKHPDLRLGQILVNLITMSRHYQNLGSFTAPEVFYIEDEDLMAVLEGEDD